MSLNDPVDDQLDLTSRVESYRVAFDRRAFDPMRLREVVRSWVTIIVAGTYGAAIIFIILDGIFGCGDASQITSLSDILQKLLLPVVTLVLGFYYGTQNK